MKNLGKVFGFVCLSVLLFSCTTDDLDNPPLEYRALKENYQISNKQIDSLYLKMDATDPIIIVKRDN